VHDELDRYRVIDVREPFELHGPLGHVAGAERIDRSALPDRAADLSDRPVLLVCRSGRRSADACRILLEHGVRDVTNLGGGMIAWHAAGLAVARTPAPTWQAFAEIVARWTSMLTQTSMADVLARWPALDADTHTEPSAAALGQLLDEIEAQLEDAGAPPDLELSMDVFRRDLERLSDSLHADSEGPESSTTDAGR
jgi:rhodanese-related sulfurtransferase